MTSRRRSARPCKSTDGSVAALVAVVLVLLIGFAGLGTEVTLALFHHRQMQSTASSAALAGATAVATKHPSDPTVEALGVAAASGFTDGVAGVRVTVHTPPATGHYAGQSGAVEVIVSQPLTLPLTSLFRPGPWNVSARAVALIGNTGIYCIAVLDPTAPGALTVSENASITSTTCGVAVNSSNAAALTMANNSTINGPVTVAGGWLLGAHALLNGSPLAQNAAPIPDPYADLTVGTVPACTGQNGTGKNNAKINLTPGHFCSGWDFGNNVQLSLAPGTYYVDSQMAVGSNGTISGTGGVTPIVNGNYATNIGNNAAFNLTAPSTGTFAGMALMGLDTTSSVVQTIANNATMTVTGAIYFPHQNVVLQNNGMGMGGGCTQVIAGNITISNNARLDNNCVGTGVRPLGNGPSRLVE